MGFDRRMLALFVALAVLGLPAFTLRVLCVGHACDEPVEPTADVPFCSLPAELRSLVAAGFREGRSPEALAVTSNVIVAGGDAFSRDEPQPEWPSVAGVSREVPLLFHGRGLQGDLPGGITLDDVAPTVAALLAIERPHPEVRSGAAIPEIQAGEPSPLILQIVWKGVGRAELEGEPDAWPALSSLAETSAWTPAAEVPSLPLDPAAVLTTIGTGGVPAEHGITGTLTRNDGGVITEAWSEDAPVSVIAALGDDLDEVTGQRARVGLIAADPTDRGLVGEDWYVDTDRDDVTVATRRGEIVRAARGLLADGYGSDDVPDLLAVTLQASVRAMDRTTEALVAEVQRALNDAILVVTATGSSVTSPDLQSEEVVEQLDSQLALTDSVVQAAVPGGLFLNQDVVADEALSDDQVLDALSSVSDVTDRKAFADVFPAIAVSFGRFC